MNPEIAAFRTEVSAARALLDLAQRLKATDATLDVTDIYRAALVKAVSGYDRFVHAIVFRGMIEAAYGRRPQTAAYGKFRISLLASLASAQGGLIENWLGPEITLQHSFLSFQKSEKVADAVRLISDRRLWPEIAQAFGQDPADLKASVDWIVDRRNQIAHEADDDPLNPGQKRTLTKTAALKSINLLARVAREIDRLVG